MRSLSNFISVSAIVFSYAVAVIQVAEAKLLKKEEFLMSGRKKNTICNLHGQSGIVAKEENLIGAHAANMVLQARISKGFHPLNLLWACGSRAVWVAESELQQQDEDGPGCPHSPQHRGGDGGAGRRESNQGDDEFPCSLLPW